MKTRRALKSPTNSGNWDISNTVFFLFLVSSLSIIPTLCARSSSTRSRSSTFIMPWLIIASSLYQKAKQELRKPLEEDDRKAVYGKTVRTV